MIPAPERLMSAWILSLEPEHRRTDGSPPRHETWETTCVLRDAQAACGFSCLASKLPEWRSKFFHLAMRRGRKIAKVAMARKLAVHLLLDVAPGMRLRSVAEARFARGRARKSRWCAVHHRRNDWASRSLLVREFE